MDNTHANIIKTTVAQWFWRVVIYLIFASRYRSCCCTAPSQPLVEISGATEKGNPSPPRSRGPTPSLSKVGIAPAFSAVGFVSKQRPRATNPHSLDINAVSHHLVRPGHETSTAFYFGDDDGAGTLGIGVQLAPNQAPISTQGYLE